MDRLNETLFVAYLWSISYYDQIACPLNIQSININMALNGPDGAWTGPYHQHSSIINEEMMTIDDHSNDYWWDIANGTLGFNYQKGRWDLS